MINLHWLYVFAGAVFAAFAIGSARDASNPKRLGNAAFWALLTVSLWFGDFLGDIGNGVLVLALVAVAGMHLLGRGSKESTTLAERERFSERHGNKLFLPALIIPFTAFVGTLLFNYTPLKDSGIIDPKSVTLVLLGLGVIIALIVCYAWLKPQPLAAIDEGSRLANAIGWAMVLPQMLASLGVIFAAAGVGATIGAIASSIIPHGSIFLAVLLFALGMVVFTMIMGNAFAAFPVMAAAIGVPILIQQDGGDPAVIGAVGMLAGFCGTLMTPMAANFNIVPAALLELKDQYGVIRAQVPTAIPLLIANILILYFQDPPVTGLDANLASDMARIALGHVTQEYPHKLDQVLSSAEDLAPPLALHPIFFGSFDWHSCVHGWWTLLTLRRLFPSIPEASKIGDLAADSFTAGKVAAELAYLERPLSRGFERPYGWAWLLKLHLETKRHPEGWGRALEPLARAFAQRLHDYLPILTYPIRVGTHFNTAFALVLSLEWADAFDPALAALIRDRARHWFGADRDCQAWEPGGDEFLSPALIEALCMARAHPALFPIWFEQFLPRIADQQPATLFEPAIVSDRSDGKIAHLDGLNLSRAWCWRELGYPKHAETHLAAALPHIAGDYMGEHWLASFALLALLA